MHSQLTEPLPWTPSATHEPRATRWLRRAITVPGTLLLFALDLALLPVLLPAALAYDLARRRPLTATRFHLAAAAALTLHVLGILLLSATGLAGLLLGSSREHLLDARVESFLASSAWRVALRLYSMRCTTEGDDCLTPGPFILMSRHASVLDVLLPLALVSRPHRLVLHYVAKRELLWDPVTDIAGHRLPWAFVRRGARDHRSEIALVETLARHLGPTDAIAFFPEGTRFSPKKRQRLLDALAPHDPETFAHAQRLQHLLPPHPGGSLAVLGHTDVVFCAHTGLEGAHHLKDLLAGALIGRTVRVRYWRVPATDLPSSPEERLRWLQRWWEQLDAWIDQHLTPAA